MINVLNLFDIRPGEELHYADYLRRVQPILDRHGATVLLYGLTRMLYRGDANQEYFGLVQYPTLKALNAFSHDPEFEEIRPLRDNSTKNYILTVIEDFPQLDDAITHLEKIAAKA